MTANPALSSPTAQSRPTPTGAAPRLYLRDDELLKGLAALWDAGTVLRQLGESLRRDAGLTAADVSALIAIGVREQPVSLLASRLGVTAPTLSRTLDGLEARGLAVREALTADRRQLVPVLTTAGRAMLDRLTAPMRQRLAHAYREAGGEAVTGSDTVLAHVIQQHAGRP
ncbi:MAG: MarR family transcriptional regulator [Hyphomonadaceae bacterium]|jgi:DNA-binding MarR family transcriptional regulator|nr:MarR family transcriptional regulator [Hyphomonadaceae bacterium]